MKRFAVSLVCGCLLVASNVLAATVSGVIREPDGSPAEGVRLWVWHWQFDDAMKQELRTGADGTFAFDREPGQDGVLFLSAVRADAVGAWYGHPGDTIDITLTPLVTVTVPCVDERGRPVAGASFSCQGLQLASDDDAQPLYVMMVPDNEYPELTAVSDDAGKLANRVPRGGIAMGRVQADGRARSPQLRIADDGQPPEPVELPIEATLTGRVVDEQGRPLSGVQVTAAGEPGVGSHGQATTGEDGRFQVGQVRGGLYQVSFQPAAGQMVVLLPRQAVKLQSGQVTDLGDLEPSPGVPLTIHVTDKQSGDPVAGLQISVSGPVNLLLPPSDEAGMIQAVLAPGANELHVYQDGVPLPYVASDEENSIPVAAELGQPLPPLEIGLTKGVMLRGTVKDEAGAPAGGVLLNFNPLYDERFTMTDDQGRFTVGPFSPDATVEVIVGSLTMDHRITHRTLPHGPQPLPRGAAELALRLEKIPTVEVTGRVLDREGRPLPGIDVVLVPGQRSWPDEPWSNGEPQRTTTDADGSYRFPDIQISYVVELGVDSPGFRRVSGGELPRDDDWQMAPPYVATPFILERLSSTLRGKVVEADGRPAAGATVYAMGQRPDEPLVTGDDGRFELTGLPESATRVIAWRGERESGRADARGGELEVRLAPWPGTDPMSAEERELLAVAVLEQAWEQQPSDKLIERMARVDPALAAERVVLLPDNQRSQGIGRLFEVLARRDPAEAVALSSLIDQIPNLRLRAAVAARIARCALPIDPAAAERLRQRALQDESKGGSGYGQATAELILLEQARGATAEVERRLADLLPAGPVDAERRGAIRYVASALDGDCALAHRLLQADDEDDDTVRTRATCLRALAERDPAAALAWFSRWFGEGPGRIETYEQDGDNWYVIDKATSALVIAERLAPLDPAAALALALRQANGCQREFALLAVLPHLAGDAAAKAAEAILAASRMPQHNNVGTLAAKPLAAQAMVASQPELAADLFQSATEEVANYPYDLDDPLTHLGYALAASRPNAARELIERSLARVDQGSARAAKLRTAIEALCALSVDDAIALAAQEPDNDGALMHVADWLLLDEHRRRSRPIGNWQLDWDGWPR